MTRYVLIDYRVKPEVNMEELKREIGDFVAGFRAHHPQHRYTSLQHAADPLRFTHFGEVVEEATKDLQKQPFFLRFSQYLRENCSNGPEVTGLNRIASTAVEIDKSPAD